MIGKNRSKRKMGKNIAYTIKGELGDIIYPAYNGTNGFSQKHRWDLIVKVNKSGTILKRIYIWDYATVRAIEILKRFTNLTWKKNGI